MSRKLIYIANIRMPTERAHGIQIVKMCEAFADEGLSVELVVPRRKTHLTVTPYQYYGVKQNFTIRYLPVCDTVRYGALGFYFETLTFAWSVLRARVTADADIVYARDEFVLYILSWFKKNLYYEAHRGTFNFFARRFLHALQNIIVISNGLRQFYIERGIPERKIVVAHDGVDLAQFKAPVSKSEARRVLGLPEASRIVMYIGSLEDWKGYRTLLEASRKFPSHIVLAVIGGRPEQIVTLSQEYPQVIFLGELPYRDLARNQQAADILVVPNSAKFPISALYTSPLKLFAHMASGKPLVVSDLPSLKEIVDSSTAYLVPPDAPSALAEAIEELDRHPEMGKRLAEHALSAVAHYTWKQRALRILQSFVT